MYQTSSIKGHDATQKRFDPSAQTYPLDVRVVHRAAYDKAFLILALENGPHAPRSRKTREIDSRVLGLMLASAVKTDGQTRFRVKEFKKLAAENLKNPISCVSNSLKRLKGMNLVTLSDGKENGGGNLWSLNRRTQAVAMALEELSEHP